LRDAAPLDMRALREAGIERLADAVQAHLNIDLLQAWLGMTACAP
jgi:adenosylcobyric acid synthase